jgi:ASPM-SPD-2-Hydin domain-containing protein
MTSPGCLITIGTVRRSIILLVLATLIATLLAAQPAAADRASLDFPKHVKFGKVAVGSQKEVFVTLTNTSARQVRVLSISVSSDKGRYLLDFEARDCFGTTLDPGRSCSYGILFSPAASGRRTGESGLIFLAQDPGEFAQIKLSGFGT